MHWITRSCKLAMCLIILANAEAGELTAQQERQIKAEIRELVHDYAVYRDSLNADAYANTFVENGRIFLHGEWFVGRDVLRKRVEDADPNEITMHIVSTGHVEVTDEKKATGIQYVTVYIKVLDQSRDKDQAVQIDGFAAMGKYYDKYQRTDDGWKFAERRMQPLFTTNR